MQLSPANMVVFASFFVACSACQSTAVLPVEDGLREAQAQAFSLEKDLATRLVELDRRVEKSLQAPLDKKTEKSKVLFPTEEERQLYLAEINLNRSLEGLYAQAWQKRDRRCGAADGLAPLDGFGAPRPHEGISHPRSGAGEGSRLRRRLRGR
jgi:hypothetical protein